VGLDDHLSDLESEYMLRFEHREPTAEEAQQIERAFRHHEIRRLRQSRRVYFIVGIILGMIILRILQDIF
jgi:hypothetical protein